LSNPISDRIFGVGSDVLGVILPSDKADFRMRMFNADGSEAEMCGNASRCIGKFVYDKHLTEKTDITLETVAGIRNLHLEVIDGKVKEVTVDMGAPELIPERIPVVSASKEAKISEKEIINGIEYKITAVGMGNPHAVVFMPALFDRLVLEEGPKMEVAEIFPHRSNIEFIKVIDRTHLEMRVWERGSGETMACGTGACAAVVAAVLNGLTDREVFVSLPGGTLKIRWDEESNHVFLTGPAEFIAEGVFYLNDAEKV
ncbi:MAG: diaminopimelate epimerase, partial [Muribaculaceae bacterium]|nr:diaminopimelate epimerase [Muribaculaceae bacterium]